MKKLLMLVAVLVLVGVAGSADITNKTAFAPYQPSFASWVEVYLNMSLGMVDQSNRYFQVTAKKGTTGVRFTVIGRYTNDEAQWGAMVQQNVYKLLPVLIMNWNQDGFPISMDDFDIDIRPY